MPELEIELLWPASAADPKLMGQIAVARLHGELAGSVRNQDLDPATGEFGLLAPARNDTASA